MTRALIVIDVQESFRQQGTMIAKDFVFAKDSCTYTIIILHHDKRLRDHAPKHRIG